MVIIALEGNIGAGKSTLLQYLSKTINVIPEPIQEWTNLDSINPLKELYASPKENAFAFQVLTIHSHLRLMKEAKKLNEDCILERCWESNKTIFASLSDFRAIERVIYNHIATSSDRPDGYIYLKTSIDRCLQRINQRQRTGERAITREYLTKLQEKQEEFLRQYQNITLVIDNDVERNNEKDYIDVLDTVQQFLSQVKQNNAI